MKIVNAMVSDRKGGMERAFFNIAHCLGVLGYESQLWLPYSSPYLNNASDSPEIYSFHPRGFYDVRAIWSARKKLKVIRPDLILTHNSKATTILAYAARGLGIPIVCFSHSDKLKRIRSADYIITLTDAMSKKFISEGYNANRLRIMPNMLIEFPGKPDIRKPAIHDNIVLGFIGRLVREKGLDDLLKSLANLKAQGIELSLRIAGSGVDRSEIERLGKDLGIEELLQFDGWVEDIGQWFSTIDLAVAPSLYEPFGLVVLEAAAFGCPMISTRVAGPESQITDNVDGWLCEPGNPDSLAETVKYAVENREKWPEIVNNAYNRAKRYSVVACLPVLNDIIMDVVRAD